MTLTLDASKPAGDGRSRWLRGLPGSGLLLLLTLLLAGPALAQTTAPAPKSAKPGQRPGSAPTPPVRYISPDPRDPIGLPPPGVGNPGQGRVPAPSRRPVPDTLAGPAAPADTARLVQSVGGPADSLTVKARRKGQVETTVKYAAKDSIQFDVTDKVARLYSKAAVHYGTTDLKAALITVNYGQNTMLAEGKVDSLTRKLLDRPVFKDGDGLYTAGKIAYNFKTKRGRIIEAVTTQGEGYVSAEVIKKTPDNELYGLHGRYTTCNLAHPHFYIQASKMKVTGKQVVTGPFNLVVGDVPTPLGFLFGFFPKPNKGRGAGLLIPTFGQAADRGYFLTNGGYYFAPNDYIGVRLTGDIYAGNGQTTPGGYGGTADVTYLKRYAYQGNFNFRFTNRPTSPLLVNDGLSASPTYLRPPAAQTFWLSWNHTPVPKPGGGRFSASVQAGSTSFNRVNSLDARRFLSPSFSSSISYSKQIRNSPVNYSVRLSQSQNVQTGVMDFILPDVSLGVARQTPYQWFGLAPRGRFYEQFAISYNLVAQNKVSNVVAARSLNGLPLLGGSTTPTQIPLRFGNLGALFGNAQNGIQHTFGLTLGSYTLLKNLRLTPSVNYGETWYNKRLSYSYVQEAQAVRIDTARGFFREYNYSAGLSLNTTFYGTVVRKNKNRFVQALRHKATPSFNYSYSPDFTRTPSAYQAYTDLPGLSDLGAQFGGPGSFQRYNGFLYPPASGGRVSALGFSLQNSVELKVRNKEDTTGTAPTRKVSLIDALDFSLSYNFVADSLRLSPLAVSFRRQVGKSLNINAAATFDPYQRDSTGRFRNKYLFDQAGTNRRLARLSAATLGITYTLNPATGTKRSVVPRPVAPANDPTLGTPGPMALYADYVDFTIPWELALTFNTSYAVSSPPLTRRSVVPPTFGLATLGVTGAVKLTENLRLNYNLGYDLVNQSITYPNITFFRDLHCWQIAGNWIPLGQTRGFNVTISAKSSLLQDLKLNRNRFTQYQ